MSYIVFARKYRPQAFDEVIGQAHITTTLKNAISQDRVAHAYIFAGPRGVGKTTTARILAKALNCEKGPTDNPCNKCPSCIEITQGTSLDILEIDGASNRGIDEIRGLRENVKFAPSKGRFKVYIIDEVHMLTSEAFNALLKTLEEPPAHVKFIFATTQAHKVPPTILSRCQRFDFRRILIKDMVDSLKAIAKKENLKADDDVLMLIAKHADGSMRDAQVVLDQISSNTLGKMSVKDASKILGAVSDEILFELADTIKSHDAARALEIINSLADDGKDIVQVILRLIEHFRNLSVIKLAGEASPLIDASAEKIKRYAEQAQVFNVEEILYIIYALSNTLDFVRKSNMSRVPFEVAMVKLTRKGAIVPSAELMERLERLEKSLPRPLLRATEGISSSVIANPDEVGVKKSQNGLGTGSAISKKEIASSRPDAQSNIGGTRNDESRAWARNDNEVLSTAEVKPAKGTVLNEIISAWPAILNCIKERKISMAMYLREGLPSRLESNSLSIEFPKSSKFHMEMLDLPDNRSLISKAIKDISGIDLRIKFVLSESDGSQDNSTRDSFDSSLDDGIVKDRAGEREDVEPIISDALDIFGGEIENGKRENKGR